MKRIKTLILAVAATALAANAVPARRVYQTFTQPDGTTVQLRAVGDERAHYYLTEDGRAVLPDTDGTFRFVTVDATGAATLSTVKAQNLINRSAAAVEALSKIDPAKVTDALARRATLSERAAAADTQRRRVIAQNGLGRFTGDYPRTGTVHGIIFLVEYKDVKFRTPNPKEYFTRLLNEQGFSDHGGTGSARDYFLDQSHGLFDVTFDVYGPVTLPNNRSYYGGNDSWGNDLRPEEMVTDAAMLLRGEVDFSKYDYDNNGKVDNIFVLYAGEGEADNPSVRESVWPHSWELKNGPTYNGKKIYGYACSNEWGPDGTPAGIGTVVHEFSHVMGLPDLYDTVGSLNCTPCDWSVLDYGPYNNNGRTPPCYSIFERNAMGWMEPAVIDGPDSITLQNIGDTNTGCIIPTDKVNEFFLLENRQKKGWDTYLPGHGMLIWHVDFNQSVWDNNAVNNTRSHQYVDIEEANNNPTGSASAMAGYAWPGTAKKTTFSSTTTPALKTWANKGIDLPLTNIKETDGVITFDVAGGRIELDRASAPVLTADDRGVLTISWAPVEKAVHYLLNLYTREDGKAVPVGDYTDYKVTGTTISIEGVQGRTEYFATVRAAAGSNVGEVSDEGSVTTPAISIKYVAPVVLDPQTADNGTVTLAWKPVDGAASYLLTVQQEMMGDATSLTLGFGSGDALDLPVGWIWNGKKTYGQTSAGYFGTAAPSLKFDASDVTLTSPVMAGNISEVSFWLRAASANSTSAFMVSGRADEQDDWQVMFTQKPMSELNQGGKTFTFTPAAGTRQLKFHYNKGNGNAALDDVTLIVPQIDYNTLEGLDRLDKGTALSHSLDQTMAKTTFRYYIEARDAEGNLSKRSNIAVFTPKHDSGVGSTVAGSSEIFATSAGTLHYMGTAGADIRIFSISGAMVASAVADANGHAAIELPAGFYIAATGTSSTKIAIR